ncbi:hypothetical protein ACE3NQ_22795 [Paenibacillus terreus]|uniref:Uncharacterized protein n=1 Tax=Paenibacillus terreus TaxID=1387834 RepID=A0ABV5BDH6_9BACL
MVRIVFQDLQIHNISNSSGLFSGINRQWKYRHTAKANEAFGKVTGTHGIISNLKISLDDNDRVDSYSLGRTTKP